MCEWDHWNNIGANPVWFCNIKIVANLHYVCQGTYYDLVRFLLKRTLDWYKDKLSITTVIFIKSENNLALLQLYVLLGTSEHMLWIQSMLRVTYGNRGLTIGCNCLGYTIIM